MKALFLCSLILILSGCAVSSKDKCETANYKVIEAAQESKIELRHYPQMILVSTSMTGDNRNGAFRKLFSYISGKNVDASKIKMTTPVFMDDEQNDEGTKIPMTAPVFMDSETNNANSESIMSFVLPASFTIEKTIFTS